MLEHTKNSFMLASGFSLAWKKMASSLPHLYKNTFSTLAGSGFQGTYFSQRWLARGNVGSAAMSCRPFCCSLFLNQ